MITGGIVTVFVSDMDRAVRFYTDTLGLKLIYRFGNQWASIEAGGGLMIGLHPASEPSPAGRKGSTVIGLALNQPIDGVVADLKKRGVKVSSDILEDNASRVAYLEDPDGNELYLNELRAEYRKYALGANAA
jgi:catechol 2,3-dioxygenase-like lactoylglutathione lyase family enzyme